MSRSLYGKRSSWWLAPFSGLFFYSCIGRHRILRSEQQLAYIIRKPYKERILGLDSDVMNFYDLFPLRVNIRFVMIRDLRIER